MEAIQVADYQAKMRRCVEDQGLAVVDDGEGNWGIATQPNDAESAAAAMEVYGACRSKVGPVELAPLTDTELESLYRSTLQQRDCLTKWGLSISEPPFGGNLRADLSFLPGRRSNALGAVLGNS